MPTVLITGATRGLGLAAARAAARRGAHVVVASRSAGAVEHVARELGGRPVVLDLAALDGVAAAAEAVGPVDVAVLNAGLQLPGARRRTVDGHEETFQVNHLAQLALLDALLARPEPPRRVILLGSSTHDPSVRTGVPAPLEGDVRAMAEGGPEGRGAGARRYSTSKLLTTATALGLARERPDLEVAAFDPGLMVATGLGRGQPVLLQRIGAAAAGVLGRLPFASTPEASGEALARLAVEEPLPVARGSVVDWRLRPGNVSRRAADEAFQDAVLRDSRALLAQRAGQG